LRVPIASMEELDSVIIRASQRLGYTSVRPMQLQAIRSFMQGNDVFISLPTGSGKSLCYSVLPYAFDELLNREGSIVVVVSPLIALMKDQVSSMTIILHFQTRCHETGIGFVCEGAVCCLHSWVGDRKYFDIGSSRWKVSSGLLQS